MHTLKPRYIAVISILCFFLVGCSGGSSLPSERQVKKHIQSQTIARTALSGFMIQDLKSFKVTNKISDLKNTNIGVVQGKVHFIDTLVGAEVEAPIDVIYSYAKKKGWQFVSIEFTDQTQNKYKPLRLFTTEELTEALYSAQLGYCLNQDQQMMEGELYGRSIDGALGSATITSVSLLNSTYDEATNGYTLTAQITAATKHMNLVGTYEGVLYHGFPGYLYYVPLTPIEQYPEYSLPTEFSGSYDIEAYPVDFTYEVSVNETSGEYRTGTLTFRINDNYSEVIEGSYAIRLQYNELLGSIKITAGNWIDHPDNTERFDMDVQYNGPKDFFFGTVYMASDHTPCGSLFVDK